MTVTLSHEVSPTFREYERTSTTVVNAYVMTAVREYLRGLQAALGERGYRGRLFVMQSSGGVATAEAMERYPVRMIESGPAAGALMAAVYGELAGHRDLVAFDMGGTTAKLALIEDGRPLDHHGLRAAPREQRAGQRPADEHPGDRPRRDRRRRRLDRARRGWASSRSGPESASSTPGPVCYGRGGAEPTVTDANLVLGYLNPDYFAGGAMRAAPGRGGARHRGARGARRSGSRSRRRRGASTRSSTPTWSWPRAWCRSSAAATRATLTLVAFGGSGPVHGCRLAQALGIPRVILPAAAGVTAAIGLLAAEVRFDVARTYVRRLDALEPGRARRDVRRRWRAQATDGRARRRPSAAR